MSNEQTIALPSGYQLENYRLETVLGHGGFGITYQAVDEDLQQVVAIKEYLPREVATRDRDSTVIPLGEPDRETFEWGLERFLDEARTLARFRHPNIVGVRRFVRANGTAYLVMDYCEGESLESVLAREGTLPPERVEAMLKPLLDALEALHAAGVTHRDIKPGNIYLREDGSPVLLDFGAARQALAQHSRSVTAMATPGYAAFEQYSTTGKQGPWTDFYGLGATLYRCVTGQRPPDSSDRMLDDELVPAAETASGCYSRPLLQQIDAALKLRPQDRPQSVHDWRRLGSTGSTPMAEPIGVSAKDAMKAKRQETEDVPEPVEVARSGRWWVWPLVVASMFVFFSLWLGSEQLNQGPEPSATATRDSAAPAWPEPPPVSPTPVAHVRLSVQPAPASARVRIMNILPAYRDGIELDPGRYDIEVSAPGYRTHRGWYELGTGERVVEVALEREPERQSAPPVATSTSSLIEGRYRIQGIRGDLVVDTVTGLDWQRCSLGKTWDGHTCVGEARTYTWDEARQAADRVGGWRLPTIDELRTLTFCTSGQPARFSHGQWCQGDYGRPTIVQEAFPNTTSSYFWSGSAYANDSNSAWVVNFAYSYADYDGRSSYGRVRLVRGGQ